MLSHIRAWATGLACLLCVAIPAVMFHRYFRGRIAEYVVDMEKQAISLLDTLDEGIVPAARPPRARRGGEA